MINAPSSVIFKKLDEGYSPKRRAKLSCRVDYESLEQMRTVCSVLNVKLSNVLSLLIRQCVGCVIWNEPNLSKKEENNSV